MTPAVSPSSSNLVDFLIKERSEHKEEKKFLLEQIESLRDTSKHQIQMMQTQALKIQAHEIRAMQKKKAEQLNAMEIKKMKAMKVKKHQKAMKA